MTTPIILYIIAGCFILLAMGLAASNFFGMDCNHDTPWECEQNGCREGR
jgi:hypothetical protein